MIYYSVYSCLGVLLLFISGRFSNAGGFSCVWYNYICNTMLYLVNISITICRFFAVSLWLVINKITWILRYCLLPIPELDHD